jgi:hypothetical protein
MMTSCQYFSNRVHDFLGNALGDEDAEVVGADLHVRNPVGDRGNFSVALSN